MRFGTYRRYSQRWALIYISMEQSSLFQFVRIMSDIPRFTVVAMCLKCSWFIFRKYYRWFPIRSSSLIIPVIYRELLTKDFRIMKQREIIYSSVIILLGFIQVLPSLLMLASSNIAVILLGIIWAITLLVFWDSTIIGRWYFRELWRSTLRLEKLLFPLSE